MQEEILVDHLKETYKNMVVETLNLAKIISDYEKEESYDIKTGIKGEAKAELLDSCLKITVNNIPGKVALFRNVGSQYYAKIKDYWQGSIMYALDNMIDRVSFDRAIIIIRVNFKDKIWDVDNHHVAMIINAIRYSRIISDDNFKKISYMVMGNIAEKENYNTEIYVVKNDEFINLYTKLSKNVLQKNL